LSFRRRRPAEITYKLLRCIIEDGEATKWDLTKIVGTTSQFESYVSEYLILNGFVAERQDGRNYFYSLTKLGEELYSLLKKDALFKAVIRISGKRLSREVVV
jgi:predicted transcriptional regulator